MDEFLKLKWNVDTELLENQLCTFLPGDIIKTSHIYKHLTTPYKTNSPKLKGLNIQNQVNFVPGNKYEPKFFKPSIVYKWEQEHCLSAIRIHQSGKPVDRLTETFYKNMEIYNSLQEKINDERRRYTEFVKKRWSFQKTIIASLQNNLYRFGKYKMEQKFNRYLKYGKKFKEIELLSMSYDESEGSVELNQVQNLLEVGALARFSQPLLKFECVLAGKTLPSSANATTINSRLLVSEDANIRKLIGNNNNIDVVISSSGLKRLFDTTDLKSKWIIPVKIEIVKIKTENGKDLIKKIVFIDKPFVKSNPDTIDLKYYSLRQLVRTNFCQYEAFKFPAEDLPVENKLADFNNKLKEFEKLLDSENEGEDNDNSDNEVKGPKKVKKNPNKILHNASYRLWKIKKSENGTTLIKNKTKCRAINILVRSKLDACETTEQGPLQPVIIHPKIELQLEYGANVPTKSELVREWTALFFRPFSTLYRVRTHWKTAEVVSIENCTMNKIVAEAQTLYQYNPYFGIGIFEKILSGLLEKEPGNYLLRHLPKNEAFIGLLKECSSETQDAFDLHLELNECKIENEINRNWVPIDYNYILPINEDRKRLPGLFTGRDKRVFNKNKKKNKKKGAKKEGKDIPSAD